MHDEQHEFYGDELDYQSLDFQIKYLTNQWFLTHDLSNVLLLKVVIDGIIKGEGIEQLYNKAIEVSKKING